MRGARGEGGARQGRLARLPRPLLSRRRLRLVLGPLLLLPLVLPSGCGDATGPVVGDEVLVQLTTAGATARNRTSADVYYFVLERETAAAAMWIGCMDPDKCTGIAPGATVTIPYSQIYGWPGSGQVIFYWWHLVPSGTGSWRMDALHSLVVVR